ncbi:MAG: helix-turn-helix transcriptional regulator [Muribaculaceae bacterium]|nr:helix-turn-helix transcriptional regulator [Muribaculaceae bacterium]
MKETTLIPRNMNLPSWLRHIRSIILFMLASISALTGFAHATDNLTFHRLYHLSPKEFKDQINDYILHNQTDSAMLCANIQASKYGKETLETDELKACCAAFRYMGMEYLNHYYNYQDAATNLLKAEQIADKYGFEQLLTHITFDEAILAGTRNDLENNFIFNQTVLDDFKKAFQRMLNQTRTDNTEYRKNVMENTLSNLLYQAIKFDKTNEVNVQVQEYQEIQREIGSCGNIAEILCNAVECYDSGEYEKAYEILKTRIAQTSFFSDRDFFQMQSAVKIAQYAVLLKSEKRDEALKLLQQHEQSLREYGMTYELLETLQLIWQHYETEGSKTLANKYALLYYTTKDEFINKSRVGKMDQAKLNLELEETRERIREMSYRQQIQTILLWSAIIIALLALSLLAVLYANYRKTKRTNRLLYEKNIALLNEGKELRPRVDNPDSHAQEISSQADLDLLNKITAVMESSPEVYNEAFSRQRLAELVGSNYKAVSRAINTCKGCNFNVLLNEYRIKEACRRLMDSEAYANYTIEAIANSVGYKSRSNFATIFKEIVGLTPSAFQKMHRQERLNQPIIPSEEDIASTVNH